MGWLADLIDRFRRRPPPPPPPPPPFPDPDPVRWPEWSIPLAQAINDERVRRGYLPLIHDGNLSTIARDWAIVQAVDPLGMRAAVVTDALAAAHGTASLASWAGDADADFGQELDHGDSHARISRVFPGRRTGETLAWGQTTPAEVVRGWMGSPGHRAQILGFYTLVGCGRAPDRDGRIVWCANFVG
jgi:hypothetical protein